jgi:hypothetical protein
VSATAEPGRAAATLMPEQQQMKARMQDERGWTAGSVVPNRLP